MIARQVRRALAVAVTASAFGLPAFGLPAFGMPSAPRSGAVPAVVEDQRWVPVRAEPDGTPVSLDVSIWRPDSPGEHPAVLLAHGFGGSKADLVQRASDLAGAGYVVLGWSARGAGDSGGRIHLDDPDYEVADARALVDLLVGHPEVIQEAPGNPRVGVVGASYGGALALMLAATDPRIDGVAAVVTWHDLADAFFPQHVVGSDQPGPFKALWASRFFGGAPLAAAAGSTPGAAGSNPGATGATPSPTTAAGATTAAGGKTATGGKTPAGATAAGANPSAGGTKAPGAAGADRLCGRFDPTVCRLFLQAAETGQPSPELLALLRAHSPAPLLTDLRAPTYLVQGMSDTLFGLEHADATARTLQAQGTPVAVRWIDGGHDGPSSTAEADEAALRAFLAGALASRLGIAAVPGFVYAVPVPRRQSIAPLFSMPAYPGLAQANRSTVALASGGPRALLNPPGGQPAALTTLAGATIPGGAGAAYQLASLPGQSVAFDTQQLESRRDLAGSPRVRLTVTSTGTSVTLFLSLWQVTGDAATLARKLVAPVTISTTPGQPATVDIDLPAATWTVEAGSRLRLLVSTTDTAYAGPRAARADQISIVGAALDLPALDGTRLPGESDRDTEALGVAGALLAVLAVWGVTAYLARRRRTHLPERPDLVGVPLVVDGLVKTYADGHRAVDDVSWRADRGQVVGLLGPNGAGKTTTLRMVLGLIAADEGQSYLNGVPVQPGSRALRHIGALVEGPGFLPHLTGRQNLHAFWAATGRDPAESHLEDVLDVAALGGAIDRPVRSYSHGMKQRLGIAQAMLGLPDLLILDEPTNGLDPPQIAAMRPMLQRYAAAGRTVVVSSHLLAEVEQTCSHVVVMHAGRVVTSGTVAELVDSADTTVVWLDPQTPRDAVGALAGRLRAHSGVAGVEVVADEGQPRLVVTAGMPRADLVRLLTDEGADIVGLSSRRHLEEAFLGVIAAAGDAELGRRRSRSTAGRTPGSTSGSTSGSTAGSTAGSTYGAQHSLSDRLRQVRDR